MIENLCIITNKYPNKYEPNVLVFVQQLVWQFAKQGVNCTVISPMQVNIHPQYITMPFESIETTDTGEEIRILRPKYFTLGQTTICGYNPAKISTKSFELCVTRTIRNCGTAFDALYSHFVTPAGIATARIGRKLGLPAFMAHGEATMMTINAFGGPKNVAKELYSLAGVVAVSHHNRKMLSDNDIVADENIQVFPNGFNPLRFHRTDRAAAREHFGFPQDEFVVGFVGSFDDRKGILRLQEAADRLGVKFACAGKGAQNPTSANCLYAKPVLHDELVLFNNACDILALPTRMEGCCNAIVEAIACGLPVVSSDRLFNRDILDETNALLIEPDDVDALTECIRKLRDDEALRQKLGEGSLEMAKKLTLQKRGENILRFLNENVAAYHERNSV